jgi:hypothetical protein
MVDYLAKLFSLTVKSIIQDKNPNYAMEHISFLGKGKLKLNF